MILAIVALKSKMFLYIK